MIKGKTKTGFDYEINENRLDNYELLEAISDVDKNPLVVITVVQLLLGTKQSERLKDHVRDEEGVVSAVKMNDEITDILSASSTKNS